MHATHTTPLRERMRQELQLAGLSERTQEANLRAVRQLATHFGRPPDQITDPELRQYLLFLKQREALRVRIPQDRLLRHPLLLPHPGPARLAHPAAAAHPEAEDAPKHLLFDQPRDVGTVTQTRARARGGKLVGPAPG